MKIKILLFFVLLFTAFSAEAQLWQRGCYYDTSGTKHTGLVVISTLDNGTTYLSNKLIGSEYFEFKLYENSKKQEIYAFDVQSVVAEFDSLVVQRRFLTDRKGVIRRDTAGRPYMNALFFKIELNGPDIKIYSKEKFGNQGVGGVYTPNSLEYFFGYTLDNLEYFNNDFFKDVMSAVMKDSPNIVAKIKNGDFKLHKMTKLIKAYKIEKGIPVPKE